MEARILPLPTPVPTPASLGAPRPRSASTATGSSSSGSSSTDAGPRRVPRRARPGETARRVVERALRIGLLALQDAGVTVNVDVVRAEFEKLIAPGRAGQREGRARARADVSARTSPTATAGCRGRSRSSSATAARCGRWSTSCSTRRSGTARSAGSAAMLEPLLRRRRARKLAQLLDPTRLDSPMHQFRQEMTDGLQGARGAPGRDRGGRRAPAAPSAPGRRPRAATSRTCSRRCWPTSRGAPATCSTGPGPRPARVMKSKKGDFVLTARRRGSRAAATCGSSSRPRTARCRCGRCARSCARPARTAARPSRSSSSRRPTRRPGSRRSTSSATTSTASSTRTTPDPATLEAAVRLARLLALASLVEREVEVDAAAIGRRADRDPRAARGRPHPEDAADVDLDRHQGGLDRARHDARRASWPGSPRRRRSSAPSPDRTIGGPDGAAMTGLGPRGRRRTERPMTTWADAPPDRAPAPRRARRAPGRRAGDRRRATPRSPPCRAERTRRRPCRLPSSRHRALPRARRRREPARTTEPTEPAPEPRRRRARRRRRTEPTAAVAPDATGRYIVMLRDGADTDGRRSTRRASATASRRTTRFRPRHPAGSRPSSTRTQTRDAPGRPERRRRRPGRDHRADRPRPPRRGVPGSAARCSTIAAHRRDRTSASTRTSRSSTPASTEPPRPQRRGRPQLLDLGTRRPGATATTTARTSPGTVGALDNSFGVVGVAPGARAVGRQDPQRGRLRPALVVRLRPRLDPRPARPERPEPAALRGRQHERHQAGLRRPQLRPDQPRRRSTRRSAGSSPAGSRSSPPPPTTAQRRAPHPGRYNEVITVSALADTDGKPGGARRQPLLLVGRLRQGRHVRRLQQLRRRTSTSSRPGKCILSTHARDPATRYMSGTSMAAPHRDRRGRSLQVEPPERDPGRGPRGAPLPRQPQLEDLDRPGPHPRAAARRLADRSRSATSTLDAAGASTCGASRPAAPRHGRRSGRSAPSDVLRARRAHGRRRCRRLDGDHRARERSSAGRRSTTSSRSPCPAATPVGHVQGRRPRTTRTGTRTRP